MQAPGVRRNGLEVLEIIYASEICVPQITFTMCADAQFVPIQPHGSWAAQE